MVAFAACSVLLAEENSKDLSAAVAPNTLTDKDKAAGWRLLWDGRSMDGWRSISGVASPDNGWIVKNGELTVDQAGSPLSQKRGDLITNEKYSDFALIGDFKITPGANSGIKFFIDPEVNKGDSAPIGPEFQILDDARHPDAKLGTNGNRTIGSLYDLIPAPKDKKVMPVGEWNEARILSEGNHVTYWLNGHKTVEYERASPDWRKLVAASKYKTIRSFGELPEGHILLQEHNGEVSFRNTTGSASRRRNSPSRASPLAILI